MNKFRIFHKERPTAFARAVTFADKVLLLADSFGQEEKLLSKLLSKTSIKMLMSIVDMSTQVQADGKRVFLNKIRGHCLKCLALLVLLKERKAIGTMTNASMKADIEGIWEAVKKEATEDKTA